MSVERAATWNSEFRAPLSPREQIIFDELRKGPCTANHLIHVLHGDDPEGGPNYAYNSVQCALTRIRWKTGFEIPSVRVYTLT